MSACGFRFGGDVGFDSDGDEFRFVHFEMDEFDAAEGFEGEESFLARRPRMGLWLLWGREKKV